MVTSVVHAQVYKTIFFKVTHLETGHTSYLFGTHHAFGKAFFDTLQAVNTQLEASDILIVESLNIPGQTAEDIINARTETTGWNKLLKKSDYVFVDELFSSSPTNYQKLTPAEMHAFLIRHFKKTVCLKQAPTDTSLSLDDYIVSKAKEYTVETMAFETIADQIGMINQDVAGMPNKVHKKRLVSIIDKVRNKDASACEETQWYSDMQMDYQLQKSCTNSLMLTDRNNRWMKTLAPLLMNKNCFVAVGLSHLMYSCGLIKQLENQGFTVIPVPVN